GTADGTILVKDIHAGNGSSNPGSLMNASGTLFFSADDGVNGGELWKSDGTAAGTVMVADINTSGGSGPSSLTCVGSSLFFSADDGIHGREPWILPLAPVWHSPDGPAAGPVSAVRFTFAAEMNTSSFSLAADVVSFVGP